MNVNIFVLATLYINVNSTKSVRPTNYLLTPQKTRQGDVT